MSLKFTVGDLTIHRIIEQETTFLPALEMLPGLTPELLAENRGWMQKAGALDANDVLILCFQSYIVKTPHHTILIDSCIGNDKPRPLRPKWNMKTDDTYMRALARGRLLRRRHRLCHVHASACRSCRLEHAAGERPLGADLPEGALRVRQDRVRLLDRNARQDAGAAVRRQRAADRRGQTSRDRARRISDRRSYAHPADAGPYARPCRLHLRPRQGRRGVQRRFDAFAAADALSGNVREIRRRSGAGGRRRGAISWSAICDTDTLCCTAHFPSPSTGKIRRAGNGFSCEAI